MKSIDKFNIQVPELGDRPNIVVVSDAINSLGDAYSGSIEMVKATRAGSKITLTSSRTTKRTSLYNGMSLQFISNFNASSGEITQVQIDSIPVQSVVFNNDVVVGEFCLLEYNGSSFSCTVVSGKLPDDLLRTGGYVGTAKDLDNKIDTKLDELEKVEVDEVFSGYTDSSFEAIKNSFDERYLMKFNSVSDMVSADYLVSGNVVELQGYYTAGDGAHHKRKIEDADDGSGVQLANGLWANIVHNGEVNVSWFGAKGNGVTDDTTALQKTLDCQFVRKVVIPPHVYVISELILKNNDIKVIEGEHGSILLCNSGRFAIGGHFTYKLIKGIEVKTNTNVDYGIYRDETVVPSGCYRTNFENVVVSSFKKNVSLYGVLVNFRNCRFTNATVTGFEFANHQTAFASTLFSFDNCYFDTNKIGATFGDGKPNASGISVINSEFRGNTTFEFNDKHLEELERAFTARFTNVWFEAAKTKSTLFARVDKVFESVRFEGEESKIEWNHSSMSGGYVDISGYGVLAPNLQLAEFRNGKVHKTTTVRSVDRGANYTPSLQYEVDGTSYDCVIAPASGYSTTGHIIVIGGVIHSKFLPKSYDVTLTKDEVGVYNFQVNKNLSRAFVKCHAYNNTSTSGAVYEEITLGFSDAATYNTYGSTDRFVIKTFSKATGQPADAQLRIEILTLTN